MFSDATHLAGDRDGGLDALTEGSWDAVVDTSGYLPRIVRASAELLARRARVYADTYAVYRDLYLRLRDAFRAVASIGVPDAQARI